MVRHQKLTLNINNLVYTETFTCINSSEKKTWCICDSITQR